MLFVATVDVWLIRVGDVGSEGCAVGCGDPNMESYAVALGALLSGAAVYPAPSSSSISASRSVSRVSPSSPSMSKVF